MSGAGDAGPGAGAACPDEAQVLDFVSGALGPLEADALHAHLAGCAACERLVAELLHDQGPPEALRRGSRLGRFVVLGELGKGGMGVVYAAFDPELDRRVALKLLRDPDPRRLLAEAQALARLSHPNVVAVYEAGTALGQVYVALELVDGVTLRSWLVQPRPWRQVLRAFVEAGRGLQAAHEAGLAHGDFKPENVLVAPDGRARVTDFGLARRTRGEAGEAATTVAGTPGYLAPEQLAHGGATALADQYAFCVALWEGLAGERPPGEPRRLPQRLRRALLRGLRDEPAGRFPSLAALLDELERDPLAGLRLPALLTTGALLLCLGLFLGSAGRRDAVCSAPGRKLAGSWDPERREAVRRALSTTAGGGLAFEGVERALDAWAAQWTRLHLEACEATRVRGEQSEALLDLRIGCLERHARDVRALTDLFLRAPPESAAQAAYALLPLDECAETDALSAQVKAPRSAESRAARAQVEGELSEVRALAAAGRYAPALLRAKETVARARKLGHAPTAAEALYQLGVLQLKNGEGRAAEEALQEAAWTAEAGRHDRLAARARIGLVTVFGELEDRADAAAHAVSEAHAALERLGAEPGLEGELETAVAGMLNAQDHCEQALPHLRAALQLAGRAGEDDARRAQILHNLGNSLRCTGDLAGAEAQHEQALRLRERAFGVSHPEVAGSLNNLANVHFARQEYAQALPLHERAVRIREQAQGADAAAVAGNIMNVGVDLISLGRNQEGARKVERALALLEGALGPESPRLALPLSVLGHVEVDLAHPDFARRHLERALRLLRGRDDEQTALARFNLARALRSLRAQPERARALALDARRAYARRGTARAHELGIIDEFLTRGEL